CCYEISHGFDNPCDQYGEECPLRKVFDTGLSHHCQHTHTGKDGTKVYVDILASPMKDDDGNVTHVVEAVRNVTPLMEAQAQQRQYAHIVSSTTDMLALLDKDYVYLAANEAYLQAFGKTADEVVGRTSAEVFGEEIFSSVIKPRADHCLAGANVRYQEWFDLPATGRKHMDIAYSPYLGPNGEPLGFVVSGRDITELKRVGEERSTVLKTAMDGFWIVDTAGRLLDFNDAYCEMTGYTRDELLDMSISDVEDSESAEDTATRIQQIIAEGSDRFETRHRCKDGRIIDVEISTRYMADTKRFSVFLRDITARKKNEDDLKKQRYFLSRAQEIGSIGTWELDVSKNELLWTDENYRIFGLPLGTALTYEIFLNCVHPDDREYVDTQWQAAMAREPYDIDHRLFVDGQVKWVNQKAELEFDDEGNCIRGTGFTQDITERKRTEKRLADSEQRNRAWIEHSPVCTKIVDLDFNLQFMSRAGVDGPGVGDITPFYGKPYPFDFYPESFRNTMTQNLELARDTGEIITQEAPVVDVDGNELWFHSTIVPVKDEAGQIDYMMVISVDTTDRKRAEGALEKRLVALTRPLGDTGNIAFEDLFNIDDIQRLQDQFAEATNVASIITHTDGTPITEPSNFCRLCSEIIRKTDKGLSNCLKSDAALGRFNPDGPVVQPCLSGGLWDAGAAIRVGGKHIANWLIGQVRDETQTEEKMRQYAREINADEEAVVQAFAEVPAMSRQQFDSIAQTLFTLTNQLSDTAYQNVQQARLITDIKKGQADRERLMSAIEQAAEVVVIADAEGTIQYVNPAFEQITGYTPEEAVGQNPRFLKSGEHDEMFYTEMWNTLIGGQPWSGRFINKTKDGTLYTEEAVISPVVNASGTTVNYVAVKRDITEEIKMEEQYRQAQKMEAVGRLAAGVAHDFNNQLQVILGYSDMLMMDRQPGDHIWDPIVQIRQAADRARSTTSHLLAFSRRQLLDPVLVDVAELLHDMEKPVGRMIGEDVKLVIAVPPGIRPLLIDQSGLHQAIMNLAVNARDAMPDGGKLVIQASNVTFDQVQTVEYPEATPGDYVLLEVIDSGVGMDTETLEKLFEPFFTTKEQGKGTGLGMPMVQGFVAQSDGFMGIDSQVGAGTTVRILLPQAPSDSQSGKTDQTPPRIEKATEGVTIMVVEDEQGVRSFLTRLLERTGYSVLTAAMPSEALELIQGDDPKPDLVISDVIMPEMRGDQLAEKMQLIDESLRFLFISGYGHIDVGGHDIIRKPFKSEDILERVRKALFQNR
ncbi:MAG: PAS domain S-box protein, partial [Phycisphaerales bacterium]|nr:PAS domain S-box protein [Phycisphaerales bacterium]